MLTYRQRRRLRARCLVHAWPLWRIPGGRARIERAAGLLAESVRQIERRHAERHERRVDHALKRAAVRDYAARRWA